MATTEFIKLFSHARRTSTSLVGVSTPDAIATINTIASQCAGTPENQYPIIVWDCSRGFWTLPNQKAGLSAIAELGSTAEDCKNPAQAVELAIALPDCSILFILNAHKFFSDVVFIQAVQNLRDTFKRNQRTLVLTGPDILLPLELAQDVVLFSEELPTSQDLAVIVKNQFKNAKLQEPSEDVVSHAVEALAGLAAFPAEQVTAMSLRKSGLDLKSLWSRKKTQVEQTRGLKLETEDIQLEDVKDADNAVSFIRRYLKNVSGIVFIDEIEKVMAGAAGDSSGVSQKMHGILLSWMADRKAKGLLFTGVQGTGKSMTAKAAGSAEKKPVIRFDMAEMEGSLVGESQGHLINALKVVDAVCQGRVLVIATSNNPGLLSDELRSRFRQGTFFYDTPSKAGRLQLWKQYLAKFPIALGPSDDKHIPGFPDSGWTGREIMTCCELAHDLEVPLIDASRYIVPRSKSNPQSLAALRQEAKGRYISAAVSGIYEPLEEIQSLNAESRTIDLDDAK